MPEESYIEYTIAIDFPEGIERSGTLRAFSQALKLLVEEERGFYPVRIERRTVTTTDWQPIDDSEEEGTT